LPRRHEEDVDGDGDTDLVFHFLREDAAADCDVGEPTLVGMTFDGQAIFAGDSGAAFGRDFPIGQDWSEGEALAFWYYGSGAGAPVTVILKDNRAPDPGPDGWSLVWAEEFDEPAGSSPNPERWTFDIGDGSANGIAGWGNAERQYYTDSPENASTDGNGNLVISVREADGSLLCYYGPCEYTSARINSQRKAEFAYGRIESRILLPDGSDGLWPAFWSLGTDIDQVGWPQAGEIDFMEYVSRLPDEIFGTIQGPGYSGGNGFGNVYLFGEPASNDYHTFTVEWEPNLIVWYVDGNEYHRATPADVAPNEWVFNDPVFLLLNVAMGGNLGGPVDPNLSLPQSMKVDYVRVYQGPDTAERFEASFVDNFVGWQQIEIPFADFARSAEQPAGAPDDGLGLNDVWGYGFELPDGGSPLLDKVRLAIPPPPLAITVTNANDSGEGSLREAIQEIATGGTISFDPALAGRDIGLSTGQLLVSRNLTIDGSAAPGLVVSGNGASRVLQVDSGATVSINDIAIADGAGQPQGGGILNFGTLNLDRVVVRDNTETSTGPSSFELGGGGIYNGSGATLNLIDSTVSNNATLAQPGAGVYGFFNSTINITRSTVSGNVTADVAGGLRSLGNSTVVNSTFSGNVSTAWHGGGIFHTDGQLTVTNSTFSENESLPGTASGIAVATFGAPANATLTNSIVDGNFMTTACAIIGGGAATITSAGGNIDSDGTCNLTAVGDQPVTDALLEPLADNGGPTQTHALSPGSPAIDAGLAGPCPAVDQRGLARDVNCDIGAYEFEID
jgi:beta-glucanase (GH16 family)